MYFYFFVDRPYNRKRNIVGVFPFSKDLTFLQLGKIEKQKKQKQNDQNMKMERPPRNYINDSSSNFPFSPSRLANKPWLQGSL